LVEHDLINNLDDGIAPVDVARIATAAVRFHNYYTARASKTSSFGIS
jgi:hypothetical protein